MFLLYKERHAFELEERKWMHISKNHIKWQFLGTPASLRLKSTKYSGLCNGPRQWIRQPPLANQNFSSGKIRGSVAFSHGKFSGNKLGIYKRATCAQAYQQREHTHAQLTCDPSAHVFLWKNRESAFPWVFVIQLLEPAGKAPHYESNNRHTVFSDFLGLSRENQLYINWKNLLKPSGHIFSSLAFLIKWMHAANKDNTCKSRYYVTAFMFIVYWKGSSNHT